MATTKIWQVKDNLGRAAEYIINPKKTTLGDLNQVLMYASDEDKTLLEDEKNDTVMLVTGVNCSRETAQEEWIIVNKVDKQIKRIRLLFGLEKGRYCGSEVLRSCKSR